MAWAPTIPTTDDYTGSIEYDNRRGYFVNGELHRNDGPALIYHSGREEWYRHGKLCRTDGPAVIDPTGIRAWYMNDRLHNRFGPAIICTDGRFLFYLNNQLIRSISEFQSKAKLTSEQMTILLLTYGFNQDPFK